MRQLTGRYGFLGYGNMGGAIVAGLLKQAMLDPGQVMVYDAEPARMADAETQGLALAASPLELARACDTLVLAVKPQQMDEAIVPALEGAPPDIRVVSIMAGISIAALESRFGKSARILRVMPNTPALVGAGAAAISHNSVCVEKDIAETRMIFEAVGIVDTVDETHMDAVTALSGSGPAYFFYMTECLIDAAVAAGLPIETARRLAAQTLLGADRALAAGGQRGGRLIAAPAAQLVQLVGDHSHAIAQLHERPAVDLGRIGRELYQRFVRLVGKVAHDRLEEAQRRPDALPLTHNYDQMTPDQPPAAPEEPHEHAEDGRCGGDPDGDPRPHWNRAWILSLIHISEPTRPY